jgi:hypothetical protein
MSTSPDELVNLLSRWLARHASDDDLRAALADVDGLSDEQREAIEDLRAQLAAGDGRGELERAVRETLEALALG